MAMDGQYRYEALPDHHIRILKVMSDGETFEAEIETFHVDHLPYFLALSWTWPKAEHGETLATEYFQCRGKQSTIPTSLHKALLCLSPQPSPSSFRIWIDAICINQYDTTEKNVQVPMMSTIYGCANKVIVWLGEAGHYTDMIMNEEVIELIVRGLRQAEGAVLRHQLPGLGLPDASNRLWPAIGNLLNRRWFSRLWIVQEVLLAQKIDVVCGRRSVTWEWLVRLGKSVADAGLRGLCQDIVQADCTMTNGFSLSAIDQVRTQRSLQGVASNFILSSSRLRGVEKPIDRVYAFWALLKKVCGKLSRWIILRRPSVITGSRIFNLGVT
jgi:hypothetical protein